MSETAPETDPPEADEEVRTDEDRTDEADVSRWEYMTDPLEEDHLTVGDVAAVPIYLLFSLFDWISKLLKGLAKSITHGIKGLPSTKWLMSELVISESELVQLVVDAQLARADRAEEGNTVSETDIATIRWRLKLPAIRQEVDMAFSGFFFGTIPDYWNLQTWPPEGVEMSDDGTGEPDPADTVLVPPWAYTAMESLYEAHMRAALGRTEESLRLYFEAKRQMLRGEAHLDESSIRVNARTLYREVESVSDSWRKDRILELLRGVADNAAEEDDLDGRAAAPAQPTTAEVGLEKLLEARELVDRYYLDQYQRVSSLRIYLLTFLGVAVLLGYVILGRFSELLPVPFSGFEAWQFYALVMAFGALGATISGIRTVEVESEPSRSLVSVLGIWLPLARLVMGSISAFLVTLFIISGIVTEEYTTPGLILGIAFASGFSERLLLQAVRSLEGVSMRRTTGR